MKIWNIFKIPIIALVIWGAIIRQLAQGNLIMIVALFSVLDVSLTNYSLFLYQKKGALSYKMEKNVIPRIILKKFKGGWKVIFACIFSTGILTFLAYYSGVYAFFFVGMLVMVNYIHCINLNDINNNWDNWKYWSMIREANQVKK